MYVVARSVKLSDEFVKAREVKRIYLVPHETLFKLKSEKMTRSRYMAGIVM